MSKDNEQATTTPQLRFPEFRESGPWKFRPLKAIGSRVTDRNSDESISRVLTNSAEHGVLDQRDFFEKDIAVAGKLDNYFVVEQGDYVYNPRISRTAPVGPISRNNVGQGVMSPLYTVFRLGEKGTDFHEHYFATNGWHDYLRSVSSTGARHDRMSIGIADFMKMPIPLPDPAEQRKIAACLGSLDDLIAAEARRLAALRRHKTGLMQQLFPRPGQTRPRLRFPEFQNAGEWGQRKISSILEKKADTAALEDHADYREIGVRSHGKGLFHKEKTTGKAIGAKRVFHVVPGALVINIVFAWEQALAVTTDEEVGFIASHRFPMFLPKAGRCDVRFIQRLFLRPTGKELLRIASPGGAGRNRTLSQKEFQNLSVLIPEPAEQRRIADCLAALDARLSAQSAKLTALRAHKRGLIQQQFPSPEAG